MTASVHPPIRKRPCSPQGRKPSRRAPHLCPGRGRYLRPCSYPLTLTREGRRPVQPLGRRQGHTAWGTLLPEGHEDKRGAVSSLRPQPRGAPCPKRTLTWSHRMLPSWALVCLLRSDLPGPAAKRPPASWATAPWRGQECKIETRTGSGRPGTPQESGCVPPWPPAWGPRLSADPGPQDGTGRAKAMPAHGLLETGPSPRAGLATVGRART